jgi:uncharacterized membrane protein
MFEHTESLVLETVSWLRLIIEGMGALVIAAGMVGAAWGFLRLFVARNSSGFTEVRLRFARYLVLGLEFQLAADILSTAVSPSWEQIGKLAAIAVIRTGLNYFLVREMREERHSPVDEVFEDPTPARR